MLEPLGGGTKMKKWPFVVCLESRRAAARLSLVVFGEVIDRDVELIDSL